MKVKRVKVSVPQGDSGRLAKGSQYVFEYFDDSAQEREIGLGHPGSESPFAKNFLQPIFTLTSSPTSIFDRHHRREGRGFLLHRAQPQAT